VTKTAPKTLDPGPQRRFQRSERVRFQKYRYPDNFHVRRWIFFGPRQPRLRPHALPWVQYQPLAPEASKPRCTAAPNKRPIIAASRAD